MPDSKISILYIGGFTRSGSTLLSYLLRAGTGFQPVGEIREVWAKGVLDDNLCSCGERFSACPFWMEVGEQAFGGWSRVDARELAASARAVGADERLIPALTTRRGEPAGVVRLREHAVRVYRAIADVSGCSVIVDSSKLAGYALLLANDRAIDLRVLHLVRDSRGVAYSWAKRGVAKPDVEHGGGVMETYGMRATAMRWSFHNALFGLLALRSVPLVRLSYERLVGDSPTATGEAVNAVGLAWDGAALSDGAVSLGDTHTIGGNPMRFRGPEQAVRLDDEWRRSMPVGDRRIVTAFTWPLLARYGYIGSARR